MPIRVPTGRTKLRVLKGVHTPSIRHVWQELAVFDGLSLADTIAGAVTTCVQV
jgi:hypothetical protein